MTTSVLVMAKTPVPGKVKTRLWPPCAPEEAAAVATAALVDTLAAVSACHADRRVLALDGDPGPWLPSGFEVIAQQGDGLGERLARACAAVGDAGLVLGMDTPQVPSAEVDHLLAAMLQPRRPALLGLAVDGGWWALGLPPGVDAAAVFTGVPMSTPYTGALQEARLRQLGLDVVHAAIRRDIDTAADLAAVASDAPWTRTAAVARALGLARRAA